MVAVGPNQTAHAELPDPHCPEKLAPCTADGWWLTRASPVIEHNALMPPGEQRQHSQ